MGASLSPQGGRSGRTGRRTFSHGRQFSDINVTPFVDVMLVLLIIFMVAAPLLTVGVAVDLPKADATPLQEQDNKPIEVSINAKGEIFIGDDAVEKERLIYLLQGMSDNKQDRRVFVRGDLNLSYGLVMDVMARVNKAGYSKVALITEPTR